MNTTGIPVQDAIQRVLEDTEGLPAFLAGSAPAAEAHGLDHSYSDIDLFVPNEGMYFVLIQHLLNNNYEITDDRFIKMWRRHKNYGFNAWHTNSMRLHDSSTLTEVNVIYKRVEGHETTRLSQVLESFDFGLLGVGYETETGTYRDMRSYLFPNQPNHTQLPLMEYRADTVGKGFMSQHIMLRTAGRYARYINYGFDLSLVKPQLINGYLGFASYKLNRTKDDDITLGRIAEALAFHIEHDEIDKLVEFEAGLPKADGLDDIFDSLE